MLQGEHSAILLTIIKLPFVIKIYVLSVLSGRFTQDVLYLSFPYPIERWNSYAQSRETIETRGDSHKLRPFFKLL